MRQEIEIPEGYEARIEGNKVVFVQKESEDERIRNRIIGYLKLDIEEHPEREERINEMLAYLEKQKDEAQKQFNLGIQAGKEEAMYEIEKEQKPAEWSEEDEAMLKEIISFLKDGSVKLQHDLYLYAGFLENRFKSLRPQPKQEWSRKDEEKIDDIIRIICDAREYSKIAHLGEEKEFDSSFYDRLVLFLKSLRPQPKEKREPMEIKYGGKTYQVHGVKALPGGTTGYIIEDEPGHYDCIMNPEEVFGGGYGVKQNGSPYPTKEATFNLKNAKKKLKKL